MPSLSAQLQKLRSFRSIGTKIAKGFASDGKKSFWALADQGIVSFGNFGVQIVLANYFARHSDISDFGAFWLLMEPMLFLNSLHTALLVYPLTIRGAVVSKQQMAWMAGTATALSLIISPLLSIGLLITGIVAQLPWEVSVAASAAMAAWQLQELVRRGLMAQLRFRAAVIGDGVSYVGQIAAVGGLAYFGRLSLMTTFVAMAITSALGAVVQAWQLKVRFPALTSPREAEPANWREYCDSTAFRVHHYAGTLEPGADQPLTRGKVDEFIPQSNDRSAYVRFAKDSWRVGRWICLGNLSGLLTGPLLSWNIAYWTSKEMLGIAYAMANLLRFVNPLSFAISTLIMPHAARASEEHGMAAAKKTMYRFGALGGLMLAPYLGILLVVPHLAIRLFYHGDPRYDEFTFMLQVATIASAVNYLISISGSLLNAVHRSRDTFIGQMVVAVACIALCIPLTAKFGLVGSWIATLIANLLQLGFHAYFIRRLHDKDAIASAQAVHEDPAGSQLLSTTGR